MADPYDPQVKTPTVSLVVATRGRRDRLEETLVPLLADPAADSSFTYHEDRDFGLRCMKAGLRERFDRSLHAEHVHARNIATLRRDARGQGAGRVEIHRVHADVLPPFDGRRFARDLPASLGRVVVACRRPRVGRFCAGVLAAAAKLAGRLRLWRLETNVIKLLRRVELQRGALDALEHS
jgi:hypothetical protein